MAAQGRFVLDETFISSDIGKNWLYIERWDKQWYPDRILLTPSLFPHTKNIVLFDLNGVGQLAFAAVMKMQQA